MIPEEQVIEIICEQFPEFCISQDGTNDLYKKFEQITDYAIGLLNKQANNELQRMTDVIHELHQHCSKKVGIAIENIFIYKLGTFITIAANRNELLELLPPKFKERMIRQMIVSNI